MTAWLTLRTLFSNPLLRYALAIAAVALLLLGIYQSGYSSGRSASERAHEVAAMNERIRQVEITGRVVARSEVRSGADRAVDAENAGRVAAAVARMRKPLPPPEGEPELITITGKKMPDVQEPSSFADAVCIPSDVADELRAIH